MHEVTSRRIGTAGWGITKLFAFLPYFIEPETSNSWIGFGFWLNSLLRGRSLWFMERLLVGRALNSVEVSRLNNLQLLAKLRRKWSGPKRVFTRERQQRTFGWSPTIWPFFRVFVDFEPLLSGHFGSSVTRSVVPGVVVWESRTCRPCFCYRYHILIYQLRSHWNVVAERVSGSIDRIFAS